MNKILEARMRTMKERLEDWLEDKHEMNWEMWKRILGDEINLANDNQEVEILEREKMLKRLGEGGE